MEKFENKLIPWNCVDIEISPLVVFFFSCWRNGLFSNQIEMVLRMKRNNWEGDSNRFSSEKSRIARANSKIGVQWRHASFELFAWTNRAMHATNSIQKIIRFVGSSFDTDTVAS